MTSYLKSTVLAKYAEHFFWTVVLAFITALVGPPIADSIPGVELSIDLLGAAAFSAIAAALQWILLLARARLTVLPAPGEGLLNPKG